MSCNIGKQTTKSREILMFVCLQKDAKQCCDVTKLDVLIVLVNEDSLGLPQFFQIIFEGLFQDFE